MRNCVILGSGRSGTSLAAGVLAKSNYFMGKNLYAGDSSNPDGYFEDETINAINEELIAQVITSVDQTNSGLPLVPGIGQRWLASIPVETFIPAMSSVETQIKSLVAHQPFCFKDPRFSYTLPVWRPFLQDAVFLCVFRHPATTVESILKECRRDYLLDLQMTPDRAMEIWMNMYLHILKTHRHMGDWLFIHYAQFVDLSALETIQNVLGATVDREFPNSSLQRSRPTVPVSHEAIELYNELCELASYKETPLSS